MSSSEMMLEVKEPLKVFSLEKTDAIRLGRKTLQSVWRYSSF